MPALTNARNTPQRAGDVFDFPIKAAVHGHQGGIAVLSGGYAAPATVATGLIAIGRFEQDANNTGGANGAFLARVRRGIFKYANSTSTDLIAQADVGADCYLVDDQTVGKTAAIVSSNPTRSRAGKVVAVDADGVWVQIGLGY
ncbi:MAG: hypothetical protein LBE85_04070 [Candidatus Accumulibacter sp.]|jgi:hypothetical protein|nr:hypothetical protein [Accumulibacter sp.]